MRKISFSPEGWEDYTYLQAKERKNLEKVNKLIKEIARNPFDGIGKSEPLKNNLSGYWSRRIDRKNRLVYSITDETVVIYQCSSHYSQK